MHFVADDDIRRWYGEAKSLTDFTRSIGQRHTDGAYLEDVVGFPLHLRFIVEQLAKRSGRVVREDQIASIPFYSLCKGLFLPLSSMSPDKAAHLFGVRIEAPPLAAEREALLAKFLGRDVGLSLEQKLGCVLGDPFLGRPSTFRRDSLVRLLMSQAMVSRRQVLDRLTVVGDIAVLFTEARPQLRRDPPLTAAEVLLALEFLPDQGRLFKFELLRSLFARTGKLEAYFLAKLVLRRAGFGFDYQGALIADALAEAFDAPADQVAHAIALTDTFHVARVLADDGAAGLKRIQLQPLVAVRPALATGSTSEIKAYPVWVERKYDGIRLMLHKATDARGSVLCAAYTRNRGDWLELVRGLDTVIKMIPARTLILDGELYGTVLDDRGAHPASVYQVYANLQGERTHPLTMRYAAFDLLYLGGEDLTDLTLAERRQRLQLLLAPLGNLPLPVPVTVSEGQLAPSKDDVNRLYHHFRAQGYEGIIAKDLQGPYRLARRDPTWLKRKPEVTLDLVLLGAVFAVTTKEKTGLFGSYVIGARTAEGAFADVGDVAGVDTLKDAEIQAEIMREGLLTGRRIERHSASGTRPGLELRPHIVVTVKFTAVERDLATQTFHLRDPKLVMIRSDKSPFEADAVRELEQVHLRQRVG